MSNTTVEVLIHNAELLAKRTDIHPALRISLIKFFKDDAIKITLARTLTLGEGRNVIVNYQQILTRLSQDPILHNPTD